MGDDDKKKEFVLFLSVREGSCDESEGRRSEMRKSQEGFLCF